MTIIKDKNLLFLLSQLPGNWLIKIPQIWYIPEGIYTTKEYSPLIYAAYVHLELMDIPEAKQDLKECIDKFLNVIAPQALRWGRTLRNKMEITREAIGVSDMSTSPFQPNKDEGKFIDIFKPWVDKWAASSPIMAKWLALANEVEYVLIPLGVDLNKLFKNGKPTNDLMQQINKLNPDLEWAWNLLISGEYERAKASAREMARSKVQDSGYYRLTERGLLVWSRYWIIVRVLGWTETMLINELSPSRDIPNVSREIIKIDKAMGVVTPPPGAPAEKPRFMNHQARYKF